MRYLFITLMVIFLVSCGKNTIEEDHVCFATADCLTGYECEFNIELEKGYGNCIEKVDCDTSEDCSASLICDENQKKCVSINFMIKSSILDSANVGIAYSTQIKFEGLKPDNYYFETVDLLPDGLILSETGLITGTPTKIESNSFKVRLYGYAKGDLVYYGKKFVEKIISIDIVGDFCDPNPCTGSNKTKCIENSENENGYICQCDDNFVLIEDNCVADICNFPSNPCVEDDKDICTASDDNSSYTCSCNNGFYETAEGVCLVDYCNADSNPCIEENRFKCSNDINEETGFKCECNDGLIEHEGACIEDICESNPCTDFLKNKCIIDLNTENKYICACKDNFYEDETGTCLYNYCEMTKPCDANVYTFKTKCTPDESYESHYVCECSDRYDVDENGDCFFNPCMNNPCTEEFRTTCISTGLTEYDYECACDDGYALTDNNMCYLLGDLCETAIEITIGTEYQGDTTEMHPDYIATCGSYARSNDSVYKFTLTESKLITATMISSSNAPFNTVLHIKDSCEDSSNEMGCSDNNNDNTENSILKNIYMEAGTYYLFADGYAVSNNGSYTVSIEADNPCYSDTDCTDNTTFCDLNTHVCLENKCLSSDLVCDNGACNRLDATCACDEGFINSDEFTCITNPCYNTDCIENSTCVNSDDLLSYTCECDDNFLKTNLGACLQNPCTPDNLCTEQNKTKCSYDILEDSIETICSCDDDFVEVDGVCTTSIMNTCPGMVILPNQTLTGDTEALENTYIPDPDQSSFSATGPDAVYQFTLTKLSYVTVTYISIGTSWDRSLYIRKNSCTTATAQVGYSDSYGDVEEIQEEFSPGTYYIFADGYSSSSKGQFSIELKIEPLCENNNECGDNQNCNSVSHKCECATGFGFGGDLECHEDCVDLGSSYFTCANPLFECNLNDSLCYKKTECDNECQENSTCNLETITCDCNQGFILNENGDCATDLCIENSVNCTGDNVSCNGVTGICTCDDGYENYVDGNGCMEDTNPCTPGIVCIEANKSTCNPLSELDYECLCDDGFVDNNGVCIDDACLPSPCGINSLCNLDTNFNSVCSCREGFVVDANNICKELEGNSCNNSISINLSDFSDSITTLLGNSKDLTCQAVTDTKDKIYEFTVNTDTVLSVSLITSDFSYILGISKGCNDNFIELSCGNEILNQNLVTGTYYLHVKSDNIGSFDIDFTISESLYLEDNKLKDAVLNKPYSESIMVDGGTPPYLIELKTGSSLSDGLTLSEANISGIPTVVENNTFTIIVTDDDGNGISKEFIISLDVFDNSNLLKPKTGDLLINEIYYKVSGDSNNDGEINITNDEFIEIVNVSYKDLSLEDLAIWDSINYSYRHRFSGNISSGEAIVIFGGGDLSNLSEANAVFVSASSGNLSLKDSGDTIRIVDENNSIIESVSYSEYDNESSINRSPDLSNSLFLPHTDVSNEQNSLFSPGKKANGDSF